MSDGSTREQSGGAFESDQHVAYVTRIAATSGVRVAPDIVLTIANALRVGALADDPDSILRTLESESIKRSQQYQPSSLEHAGASRSVGLWALLALVLLVVVVFGAANMSAIADGSLFHGSPPVKTLQESVVLIEVLDRKGQRVSLGSGIIIADGQVITNVHVVRGGATVRVTEAGLPSRDIEGVLGTDTFNDLVMLQVPTDHSPAKLGSSGKVKAGDKVMAIGNPLGLTGSISEGIISETRAIDGHQFIQMTAPISPGSSGGALFGSRGELIGITVAVARDGQNVNLAVPIELVKPLIHVGREVVTYRDSGLSHLFPNDRELDGFKGPVASVVEREPDMMFESSDRTDYDQNGGKLKEVSHMLWGTTTTTFGSDRYQRVSTATVESPFGHDKLTYVYDSLGRLIQLDGRSDDGPTNHWTESYQYDAADRLIRTDGTIRQWQNTYSVDGLLLADEMHERTGWKVKHEYSDYKLDQAGNWIQRTTKSDDNHGSEFRWYSGHPITSIQIREITYYQGN